MPDHLRHARSKVVTAEPEVWVRTFGSSARRFAEDLGKTLAGVNFKSHLVEGAALRGPGVVVFEKLAPEVCAFLRDASDGGAERVLAVAATRDALAHDAPWRLLAAGASDVLPPERANGGVAAEIAARLKRWAEIDQLVDSNLIRNNLVGRSAVWRSLLRQVVEASAFTDAPVLLSGESGTGKELVARLIHSLDRRKDKRDLVVLDCTTVVPELSGSEFFGHERGAFTGAERERDGAFALADRGTLFLDEVGELPLSLQPQLLRVVQEHTYKRVGGNAWLSTRFRLVCATNRDLVAETAAGRFRTDLYYRIASIVCRAPPLRERTSDVLVLFNHFWAQHHPENDEPPELDDAVHEFLLRRAYPGNVRDLKQLVARISYRHVGRGPITLGDVPEDERLALAATECDWPDNDFDASVRRALALGVGLREITKTASDVAIRLAVAAEDGNLQRAARRLGVTDRALQMRKAQWRGARTRQ